MIDPVSSANDSPRTQEISQSTMAVWHIGRAISRAVQTSSHIVRLFHDRIDQLHNSINEIKRSLINSFNTAWSDLEFAVSYHFRNFIAKPKRNPPRNQITAPLFKNYSTEFNEILPIVSLDKRTTVAFERSVFFDNTTLQDLRKAQKNPLEAVASSHFGEGITNGGNSCYIASVLQALRFISRFRDQLEDKNLTENDLAQGLKKLYSTIEGTENHPRRATFRSEVNEFRKVAMDYGWNPTSESSQEDPTAFCQFLLDQLGFSPFKFKTKISYNYELPVLSLEVQGGVENYLALPLGEIRDNSELAQVVIDNVILEEIEKEKIVQSLAGHSLCPATLEAISNMKDSDLIPTLQSVEMKSDDIPHVLPLSLRRYGFNPKTKEAFKIQTKIHPSEIIDFPITDNPNYRARFRLTSFINHDGASTSGGHYRAYVPALAPKDDENMQQQLFLEFDDGKAKAHLHPLRVQQDVDQNGYLFFYELIGVVEIS